MKIRFILAVLSTPLFYAASVLAKTGDLAQFNQRQGPWVWKDIYIFIEDCDKKILAAHPMRPDLIGKSMLPAKDAKGNSHYQDPTVLCDAAKR